MAFTLPSGFCDFDHAVPLPFDIGGQENVADFWSNGRSLSEALFDPRKHAAFRAVDDPLYFNYGLIDNSLYTNPRLVGRSAWNTRWKLVIPARSLHAIRPTGQTRFIESIDDIKLYLKTYSYSGN